MSSLVKVPGLREIDTLEWLAMITDLPSQLGSD